MLFKTQRSKLRTSAHRFKLSLQAITATGMPQLRQSDRNLPVPGPALDNQTGCTDIEIQCIRFAGRSWHSRDRMFRLAPRHMVDEPGSRWRLIERKTQDFWRCIDIDEPFLQLEGNVIGQVQAPQP